MADPSTQATELISAVQQRLARAMAVFRDELAHIQAQLTPPAPSQPAPAPTSAPAQQRRIMQLGTPTVSVQAPPVPTPGPSASVEELLASALTYGLKQRSYDETDDVIAPNPINQTGNSYDAKVFWDHWIVSPTVDTLVSFKGPPTQNTPVLPAGQAANFQIRAKTVWYQAAPGITTAGLLYIRVARYVDQPTG